MDHQYKKFALLLSSGAHTKRDPSPTGCNTMEIGVVGITEDGKLRNGLDTVWNDFKFSCQWNNKENASPDRHTYAWRGAYRSCFSVELRDAERMVKHLRKLDKADRRASAGPTTFSQWLGEILPKLGIHEARIQTAGGGWSYDESVYKTLTLAEALAWIEDEIDRARGPVDSSSGILDRSIQSENAGIPVD